MVNFLELPTIIMCMITAAVSAGISLIALVIIRRHVSWKDFQENHEVGGFLFNALGLIYAVLIAFIVYVTWAEYSAAKLYCDDEASALQDLYLNSQGLPQQFQYEIKEKIIDYINTVINEDWPLLSIGQVNENSIAKLAALWSLYVTMDPVGNERQRIVYGESLGKLNDITDSRRQRVLSSQTHIPGAIWTVIVIGAMTSVGFSLFFGTRKFKVQAAMTSLFAMTNGIILLLILALDHPYTGDIKVTSEAFSFVLDFIQSYSW